MGATALPRLGDILLLDMSAGLYHNERLKRNNQLDIFDSLANIVGAGQFVFGSAVLSAVLFIGTFDALGAFARFAASALMCQLITVL